LSGVQNFRDFGGYRAQHGPIRTGRLFRSAHLAGATEADLQQLQGLNLCLVVDLRRPAERTRDVTRLPAEFGGLVMDTDAGLAAHAPHLAFADKDVQPAVALEVMQDFYRKAPFDAATTELGRRYFPALAEAEGAVLVHCAAGKDRTGLLVALTHAALGVHRDDIFADYLLTNAVMRLDARLPELTRTMTQLYGREIPEAVVRAFLRVEEAYLAAAFAAIGEAFGGPERYLVEHLNLTPATLRRIEARLIL
jgi:protein tyrosine/serine phosphatase